MNGLMMQQPLLISSLLTHAERHHAEQEIVSRRVEGDVHRTTYRELAARSRRMANALAALGVGFGDRVATLAWNGYRHMELYYAGVGLRCRTAHNEPAAASGPGGLACRPCRGPGPVLRPELSTADRGDR
jgi:acyl-CoA synthetase (AMP-forming)/AMP-acid ligase II